MELARAPFPLVALGRLKYDEYDRHRGPDEDDGYPDTCTMVMVESHYTTATRVLGADVMHERS